MTADPSGVTVTRETLYEQVWTTAMRNLAPQYGLSDVGLAKICKKHDIPRPTLGYWAKLEHGYKPRKAPLPKCDDPKLQSITIRPYLTTNGEGKTVGAMPEFYAIEKEPANRIIVPEQLTNPHPLIQKTETSIQAAKPDENGLVSPRAKHTLNIHVSPQNIDRALRVMDAFLKACVARGFGVSIADGELTCITVENESVSIALSEGVAHEERPLTPEEEKDKKSWPWHYNTPRYRYFPDGKLNLRVNTTTRQSYRRRWGDGDKQRLENGLNSFMTCLRRTAQEIKEDRRRAEGERLAAEEAARKRVAWEKERQEKLQLIREEEERLKQFEAEMDSWHKSRRMRQYIEAVRQLLLEKNGKIEDGSQAHNWLVWATQQADRADPLVKSPPSILDEKQHWERGYY